MHGLGFAASFFIGVSLGLTGGGGSILTVPVLVYLFTINPVLSTSYSLFIVGTTSLIGAINNYRKRQVRVKLALLFALCSTTTVFVTRKFILPLIPEKIITIGNVTLTHELLTMVLFAALMIMAANAMIRNGKQSLQEPVKRFKTNFIKLLSYGVAIGLATGLLGAGGGFLLIPTLVILVGLPMKVAIGTSLFIIAMNSLIGFTGDLGHFAIEWILLVKITAIAVGGIFTGGLLGKNIQGEKLKIAFGWFVLVMGVCILIAELFFGV